MPAFTNNFEASASPEFMLFRSWTDMLAVRVCLRSSEAESAVVVGWFGPDSRTGISMPDVYLIHPSSQRKMLKGTHLSRPSWAKLALCRLRLVHV